MSGVKGAGGERRIEERRKRREEEERRKRGSGCGGHVIEGRAQSEHPSAP